MAAEQQITLTDKLLAVPVISRLLLASTTRLLTRPFSSGPQANTLLKDVIFAGLRKQLSINYTGTEQFMGGTTEAAYLAFAKKRGFQPDTDVLGDNGPRLHWLGSKSAEKVVLYCHGGGYALAAHAGHFEWLFGLQEHLSKTKRTSAVVIGYTLSPYAKYPTQLRQAAESLQHLLNQQKKPGDIILAGDSAGGNMISSLFSHLLHPHPEVQPKITLNEPLLAAVFISPWTSWRTDDASVKRNATSDLVTAEAAIRWRTLYLGSAPYDNYNEPVRGDAEWFKGLDNVVKDILVWGGSAEILIDSIEAFAKKLQASHPRTEYSVEEGAAHEDFIVSLLLGYKQKSAGTKAIEDFLTSKV